MPYYTILYYTIPYYTILYYTSYIAPPQGEELQDLIEGGRPSPPLFIWYLTICSPTKFLTKPLNFRNKP